ncbi:MAG: hypothetical protein J5697_03600 [Clostridia bacterium]|nr:hypothetical protein [Clostridia bacterium]
MEERYEGTQFGNEPFFRIIYKNLFLIIIVTVICAGIALGIGFCFVKPVYTASRTVILRASVENVSSGSATDSQNKNDVSLAKKLLPNVTADLANERVEEYANETYAGEGKIDRKNVETKYTAESFVFVIKYSDTDDSSVNAKLDAIINGFNNYLDVDNADYEVIMAKNLRLVSLQNRPSDLTKKYNIALYVVLGAALGVAASIAFVFIRYSLDNTVKSRETLESLTGAAVISFIDKE